jgi:hypothetical protein
VSIPEQSTHAADLAARSERQRCKSDEQPAQETKDPLTLCRDPAAHQSRPGFRHHRMSTDETDVIREPAHGEPVSVRTLP